MKKPVTSVGPPGCGKGTTAAAYVEKYPHTRHISTGDMFRNMNRQEGVGAEVHAVMEKGALVSDSLTFRLFDNHIGGLQLNPEEGIIFDGIPRNPRQVAMLEEYLKEQYGGGLGHCLWYDISFDELLRRLTGRVVCSFDGRHGTGWNVHTKPPLASGVCDVCSATLVERADAASVWKRLREYWEETYPMLAVLREFKIPVTVINANVSPQEVLAQVEEVLNPIFT